jgi:hypothetical protein
LGGFGTRIFTNSTNPKESYSRWHAMFFPCDPDQQSSAPPDTYMLEHNTDSTPFSRINFLQNVLHCTVHNNKN